MTSWARHERAAILAALRTLGPDAPTLCEGWATRDMAAHLYVRERRPDAALGVLPLGPLSAYTERVMASVLRVHGYDDLLRRLERPPAYLRLTGLDEAMNTIEYFVHTEDVRRPNGMADRALPDELEQVIAKRLSRQARLMFRRVEVPVRLVPTVGPSAEVGSRSGGVVVEVRGLASEIMLFAFGRKSAAHVELSGPAVSVDALRQAQLGL